MTSDNDPQHGAQSSGRDYRGDWDERARRAMRLYVATWDAGSDEEWAEGAERDAAFLLERLPPELGPGARCLDLGCGPGRLLPRLSERFDEVLGCDVSPEMLEHARTVAKPLGNTRLELVDGKSLAPFVDDHFQLVVACAVFIHLDAETLRSYLAEVARVLAPGGLLAATFNSRDVPVMDVAKQPAPSGQGAPELGDEVRELIGGATWDGVRISREELEGALQGFGMQIVSLESEGDIWIVVARRD